MKKPSGMSRKSSDRLRYKFAASALLGVVVGVGTLYADTEYEAKAIAKDAWDLADAMLAELNSRS